MPQIIPIRDLKNTSEISRLCHDKNEPIFITKNGYGDMVIMSIERFNNIMQQSDIYAKLATAENQVKLGQTLDASNSLQSIRKKYNV